MQNIIASDLKSMIGKVNIIDIRKNYLYNLGNIPSSKNIPSSFLLKSPEKYLNKEEIYYIYCSQGMESINVCNKLSYLGYKVVNVLGGYQEYISNY